jgi:Tol biopolymer transport system component
VKKRERRLAIALLLVGLVIVASSLAAVLYFHRNRNAVASQSAWTKITNFPDSATQPAFSPDGHMIAFIRGPETFVTPGEIYVKILPDGDPVQLTHDGLPKMAPTFSLDG